MAQFEAVFDYENPAWIVVEWTQIDETTRRAEIYDRFIGSDAERNAVETAKMLQEGFEQDIADWEATEFDADFDEFPMGEFPRHFVY
jgi:hypothetical protein